MKTMRSIYEAKSHFSELVAEVERTGTLVIVTRHGRPVADIVPHRDAGNPLAPDPALSGARFKGDPLAPVDTEDWPEALR